MAGKEDIKIRESPMSTIDELILGTVKFLVLAGGLLTGAAAVMRLFS